MQRFLTAEAVRRCTDAVRVVTERPPERRWNYVAFTDVSGGSSDSFTLAIAHMEGRNAAIDAIRERVPPFPPEQVTEEYCTHAQVRDNGRSPAIVTEGSGHASMFPAGMASLTSHASGMKSDLYIDFLAMVNSETVGLVEHDRLHRQLVLLERRRTARGGKDTI